MIRAIEARLTKTLFSTSLDTGDMVVFSRTLWNRDNLSSLHFFQLDSAPLEDVVPVARPNLYERLPEQDRLDAYRKEHFQLLRSFEYQGRTFAWVYKVPPSYDRQKFFSFLRDVSGRSPEPPGRLVSFAPQAN